jgi:transcription antitermination protein NusB
MQRMMRRSRAREVALQLLFQHDLNASVDRASQEHFLRERLREPATQEFCLALVDGVQSHLEELDAKISEAAENWRLPRMAVVDRNVLRIGAFELFHMQATPVAAVMDEAIELARRFGSAESPRFVNGVLDKLKPQEAGVAAPEHTQPTPDQPPLL